MTQLTRRCRGAARSRNGWSARRPSSGHLAGLPSYMSGPRGHDLDGPAPPRSRTCDQSGPAALTTRSGREPGPGPPRPAPLPNVSPELSRSAHDTLGGAPADERVTRALRPRSRHVRQREARFARHPHLRTCDQSRPAAPITRSVVRRPASVS
ncbi:hypothetical protein ACFPM0_15315 [Pseudonocardia sulfidoxydans]|uniref:hypothetical protein n=1 Tax=Pseudonocardia sulfidoxydans TaxID=54011 RepID=UPI0036122E55